ncbi:MAG TPA: hypothetical protein VH370_14830 [Humisphaera sp.]|jgi:hypothetical protein|nr:hypothetical protein [Humisphaera sp.]
MTESHQLQDDLRFVRNAVHRRDSSSKTPPAIYYVIAVYVLIGYAMIDVVPKYCGLFFFIGGILVGVIGAQIGRRAAKQTGEEDAAKSRTEGLHWGGGIILAVISTAALAVVMPPLRSTLGSQVLVVMIGIVYFLGGVHFERHFLWLGPVLIAGGVLVGFVPHYGWTMLGAIIALGLVVPTFFPARDRNAVSSEVR